MTQLETPPPNAESKKVRKLKYLNLGALRPYGIIFAFMIVFAILSFMTSAFATTRNILNVLDQAVQVGLAALGVTLPIIGGSFDLSLGSVYAIAGCVAAFIARSGYPGLGIAVGILLSFLLGCMNGLIITKLHINSFVATLASGLIIGGIAYVTSSGRLIQISDPSFAILGRGYFLGIKFPIYVFFVFAILVWFLLARTTIGRYIYAIGGNEEAARLSGVHTDLIRILTFAISGLGAGLAGVIAASRISTGEADVGGAVTLSAIAAVVIGGTSILGGEGAIWRTIFGVLLLQLISNGMNILNIPPFYQLIVQGLIILFAVTLDAFRSRSP
ncbi:MAG: ABC transporter permease [Anaerolineales bacterium]|jgi:ribose transport system permease protein